MSRLALVLLLPSILLLADSGVARVRVSEVAPIGAAAEAGLRVGATLDAWQRVDEEGQVVEEGRLRDAFEFLRVRYEVAPRGAMRLLGADGESWGLPWEEWGLEVKPVDDAAEPGDDQRTRAWRLAQEADDSDDYDEVDRLYEQAIEAVRGDAVAESRLRLRWGRRLTTRSEFDRAWAEFEAAEALDQERGALAPARAIMQQAAMQARRQDLEGSRLHYERLIEILREHARPGPTLAEALGGLGYVLQPLGQMSEAEELLDEAWALVQATGIEGRVARQVLNNRGTLRLRQGDSGAARGEFERIVEISNAMGVRDRLLANALQNRGVALRRLGDLDEAERSTRESLAVREEVAPRSPGVAQGYLLLGNILLSRMDLDGAADMYARALAIHEELTPGTLAVAVDLVNLGVVRARQKRLDETEDYYRRAADILEEVAPKGGYYGMTLFNLAALHQDRGELDEAAPLLERALAVTRHLAPGSLEVATALAGLGRLASQRERPEEARDYFQQAADLYQRLAPGTHEAANMLFLVAEAHEKLGQSAEAGRCYCDALDELEQQRRRLGGTEGGQVRFGEEYVIYADRCLLHMVATGRVDEALGVLESTRARFLLSLFADRDGLSERELGPELSQRRAAHQTEVDEILGRLARLGDGQAEAVASLRTRLEELEDERQTIAAEVRFSSPRLADLEADETLTAAEIGESLDPGTAMISYWVGRSESLVFVMPADERRTRVASLGIGRAALEDSVSALRAAITTGADRATIDRQAAALYQILLSPIEEYLEDAERLLVSPDGSLHLLPFAVLRRSSDEASDQYLLEWKPLHVVSSVTLFERLAERRRPFDPQQARVVAFGDPRYDTNEASPEASTLMPAVVALRERGFDLAPLPGTRREIEALNEFFPGRVETHLGSDATEDRVKSLGDDVDVLHFACHAVADEEIPSGSALLLSLAPEDGADVENGILQAWEILESVRIDASLVTLSACETALGARFGGEGIAGLTRAFQYAGARSIVASLWNVPDEPTAQLMRTFYSELTAGTPKDEALRRAQLQLLREGATLSPARALGGLAPSEVGEIEDSGHPIHWAAMQLIGDWR